MSEPAITWVVGALTVRCTVLPTGSIGLGEVRLHDAPVLSSTSPCALVQIGVVTEGHGWPSRRYVDSVVGTRARYVGHSVHDVDGGSALLLRSIDEVTGLDIRTTLTKGENVDSLRVTSEVRNTGAAAVQLTSVSSVTFALDGPDDHLDRLRLWYGENDGLAENRWRSGNLRQLLPDVSRDEHDPRGCFERTARGGWSTDGSLPVGVLVADDHDAAVAWQVEHNGSWHWQVGERRGAAYVSVLGPTDAEHDWQQTLAPGESTRTVPVTVAFSDRGLEGAASALTLSRRHFRRRHPDHESLPVIYNDYMNTLMGDPTTAKLLPLIDSAASVGAEVFCIDAGWYAEGANWGDGVGVWEPSTWRFPGGLLAVIDHIRDRGMAPGLWLEPEVVWATSPVAEQLPDEAFFVRHGQRLVESGRFHLDLRHPAARAHLDKVVDRLVATLGIEYFKLDYNINPGPGTDATGPSLGLGLLGHNRALLDWLDGIAARHPQVTLENCASGGMRVDYAMLSRTQLQSTSDQQDYRYYPPIAAAAAMAIAPEQAASWSYPQPDFSDDAIAYTMSTGLLGRLYLSGHLDRMTPAQAALVREGVGAFRQLRAFIRGALPFWPLGLPGWEDGWVGHGLRDETQAAVTLWRRHSPDHTALLPAPWPVGEVELLFPLATDARAALTGDGSTVEVCIPRELQAVTLRLAPARPS